MEEHAVAAAQIHRLSHVLDVHVREHRSYVPLEAHSLWHRPTSLLSSCEQMRIIAAKFRGVHLGLRETSQGSSFKRWVLLRVQAPTSTAPFCGLGNRTWETSPHPARASPWPERSALA